MANELLDMVESYREEGIIITDEEVDEVKKCCIRKMEVAKVQNPEEYLPLLFEDEIRNYLFRRTVNTTAILRMFGKEAKENVRCM